jgi:hypothetical protein
MNTLTTTITAAAVISTVIIPAPFPTGALADAEVALADSLPEEVAAELLAAAGAAVTLARTPDSLLENPAASVACAISLVIDAINSLFSLTPVGIAAAMLEMKLSRAADAVGTMAETSEASIALRAELVGKGN